MPFPGTGNHVFFRFWIGDRVNIEAIGFDGTVVALAVNSTEGNVVLIDNGLVCRWYPEVMGTKIDGPVVCPKTEIQVDVGEVTERTSTQGDDDHGADDIETR